MTWHTVVNVFAVIGALYLSATVAGLVMVHVFVKNADEFNRHSSPR